MSACPACGKDMGDRILVCEACWWKVPPKDRALFRSMYERHPNNPASYRSKADQIIRDLRESQRAVLS
jgi:predicted amidophosphoribosyltransferase